MATTLTNIEKNGLLAELAYLRLEDSRFMGDIKNSEDIRDFLNISKNNNGEPLSNQEYESITGIKPERKQAMIDLLNKYEIVGFHSNASGNDFQGMMLKENGTDNYAGAIRGTDSFTDAHNDVVDIGLNDYNNQNNSAKFFLNEMIGRYNISKENLTLTGHSLGAIHVQQLSMEMQVKGYAYNPFGSSKLLSEEILNNQAYKDFAKENIYTISYNDFGTVNGDALSNFVTNLMSTEHVGTKIDLYGKNLGLEGHSSSNTNLLLSEYIQNGFDLNDIEQYNKYISNLFFEQMDNENVDIHATKPDGSFLDFRLNEKNWLVKSA